MGDLATTNFTNCIYVRPRCGALTRDKLHLLYVITGYMVVIVPLLSSQINHRAPAHRIQPKYTLTCVWKNSLLEAPPSEKTNGFQSFPL